MLLVLAAVVLLGCGSERADVKTLSDSEAAHVDLLPRAATVEDLISLDPPTLWTRGARTIAALSVHVFMVGTPIKGPVSDAQA